MQFYPEIICLSKPVFQHAMQVVGLDEDCREDIVSVVAGILHLGNITFVEKGNYAAIADPGCKF